MKRFSLLFAIVGVAAVIAVVLFSWAVSEYGGQTYKGKRASEWRRMADDIDPDTKLSGYRGLVETHPLREVERRFDRETSFSAKLIMANAMVHDPAMRPKVVVFIKQLIADRVGDAYFTDSDFRDIVGYLAANGEADELVPLVEKWTTKATRPGSAKEVLQIIEDNKPKPATGPTP